MPQCLSAGVVFLLAVLFVLAGGGSVAAKTDALDPGESKALAAEIDVLLAMLSDESLAFRPSHIKTLLSFATRPKDNPAAFTPPKRKGHAAAYWEADVTVPMEKVISYLRHPAIPNYIFFPASLRSDGIVRWSGSAAAAYGNSAPLPPFTQPRVLRWVEYEVNVPDKTTGTYYRYEQDRMVLLFQYEGREYQVSVGKLRDKSTAARKGTVVGPERNWNYFYSGVEGMMQKGLGWVDAYIYDGVSVNVLYEPVPGAGSSRICLFKWLRAGWASINFAKSEHILAGFKRFSKAFKEVIESSLLPLPQEIADYVAQVGRMSEEELRAQLIPLAKVMEHHSKEDPILSRREFRKIIVDQGYVSRLNREEMESELLRIYLKEKIRPTESMFPKGDLLGAGGAAGIAPGAGAVQ